MDSGDDDGVTPLMRAVQHEHVKVVKILIDNGAKVGCKNLLGKTAMDLLPKKNSELKEMLKQASVD